MYEIFVESVPVLKSLEVRPVYIFPIKLCPHCLHEYWLSFVLFFFKPSERMKIVDVIGEKNYKDGDRIIAQVSAAHPCTTFMNRGPKVTVWFHNWVFYFLGWHGRLLLHCGIGRSKNNDEKQGKRGKGFNVFCSHQGENIRITVSNLEEKSVQVTQSNRSFVLSRVPDGDQNC